ncbi:hypothetical protein GW12_08840 [Acinetobacter sp. HR7]|nr:hypothetical protein GW12_08840 [Acinetobacter sp. HR7]
MRHGISMPHSNSSPNKYSLQEKNIHKTIDSLKKIQYKFP